MNYFIFSYQEKLPVEGADLMLCLESLVIATGLPSQHNNIKPLRIALRCLVIFYIIIITYTWPQATGDGE